MSTDDPSTPDGAETNSPDEAVPHVALSGTRGRPPAKVFATKTLAQRSLIAGSKTGSGTLLERLHGPVVKWPRNPQRKSGSVAKERTPERTASSPAERKGENMS